MIDTINSRRSFFFLPTCWTSPLLSLLPRSTNTQHKHPRPLHVKQHFPCRPETAFKFCRSNTGIILCTVILFATLNWRGGVSTDGHVGRLFVPLSWVCGTSGSKRQCLQRTPKSLCCLVHVPAILCAEDQSSTLLRCSLFVFNSARHV
jgi:hypothetical protein